MFIDEVEISVKAGDGGNGIVAFRREKFVPRGGPSGGDGGRGGSIVLVADAGLTTLMDFRYKHNHKAARGVDGGPKNMTGASGADLELRLPIGTQVYDAESGELLADLEVEGKRLIAAEGGRGGRGNAHFATSIRQTPRYAENGEPGESRRLRLELKLLADVGLIGFPNVGKSTLISQVSAARPKIADYPFTTLVPNLGVARTSGEKAFVVADIPGLIEGAHEGAGLGIRFLRHIERTRLLVHILEVSGLTGRDPIEDFEAVNGELRAYSEYLAELPQVVALNKVDLSGAREIAESVKPELEARGFKVFVISAATTEGVRNLVDFLGSELERLGPQTRVAAVSQDVVRISPDAHREGGFEVKQLGEHEFEVLGRAVERMVAMASIDNDEALRSLHRKLDRMGVLKALKKEGVQTGDAVRIGRIEFDYQSEDELE